MKQNANNWQLSLNVEQLAVKDKAMASDHKPFSHNNIDNYNLKYDVKIKFTMTVFIYCKIIKLNIKT